MSAMFRVDKRSGHVVLWVITIFTVVIGSVACSGDAPSRSEHTGVTNAQPGEAPTDSTSPSERDSRDGGVLTFALAGDATGWNPASDVWPGSTIQIARAIFEPLAAYDENNQLQPDLAESIRPNDDFTEWSITVREGIFFTDGTPLDAEAVKVNLEAQLHSEVMGELLAPVQSIAVTGERQVQLVMRSPWSTFAHVLSSQAGFMAAPSMFEEGWSPNQPVGTGPYLLESWTRGVELKVVRNESYRRPGLPHLDGIVFRFIANSADRTDAITEARVDVIMTDDPYEITRLTEIGAAGDLQVVIDGDGEGPKFAVALNVAKPPFIDFTARQVVSLATDRRELSDVATGGLFEPIKGPVSPTSPWFEDVALVEADQAAAKAMADEYELRYGRGLTFTVLVAPDPVALGVAAQWQRQLARVGVVVEMVPTDPGELESRKRLGDFEAVVVEGFGDWHPDFIYPMVHQAEMTSIGVSGSNINRFGTDRIDEALDEARATDDLVGQVDAFRTVEAEMVGGMSYVFMLRVAQAIAVRGNVRDLTSWTLQDGRPGLDFDGRSVSLTNVWLDPSSS